MLNIEQFGHLGRALLINEKVITIDGEKYAYTRNGFDEAPEGVESVEVLVFTDPKTAEKMDGVLITIPTHSSTPIQHFIGPRIFCETIVSGEGVWLGVDQGGSSLTFSPYTTKISEENKNSGHIKYGFGWSGRWINVGKEPLVILELCLPPYKSDNTVELPATFNNRIVDSLSPQ